MRKRVRGATARLLLDDDLTDWNNPQFPVRGAVPLVGVLLADLAIGFKSSFWHDPAGADAERPQEIGMAGQDRVYVACAFLQPPGRVPR
jgi:hypothetical protein